MDLDEIDGLAARVLRDGQHAARAIVLKRSAWSERKRFSLAHKLGHMFITAASTALSEAAANRFAGAFLVPADALRAEVGAKRSSISLGELVSLKRRYGVSLQALTYRAKDLGIIDRRQYADLFRVFAERGWHTPPFKEPEFIDPSYEEPRSC